MCKYVTTNNDVSLVIEPQIMDPIPNIQKIKHHQATI